MADTEYGPDTLIKDAGLGTRLVLRLKDDGIETLGELAALTPGYIMRTPNLGKASLAAIEAVLRRTPMQKLTDGGEEYRKKPDINVGASLAAINRRLENIERMLDRLKPAPRSISPVWPTGYMWGVPPPG